MSREPRATASSHYAWGQLHQALEAVQSSKDPKLRERAQAKVERWQAVLQGMSDGSLRVGSRTPVANTPAWVTLEVAHGGFATGRFLAEGPPRDDEIQRIESLTDDIAGTTDRERLNLWHLTDEGQRELRDALAGQRYTVDVPEEAALLVVAWLLEHRHYELVLDLVSELRPLMHRLRFTPRLQGTPRPAGMIARLETAGTVAAILRQTHEPEQIAAMRETLRVWHPLFDRLVELWADTVEGELPHLATAPGESDSQDVVGGWPCQRWPDDWAERRAAWLADYHDAVLHHQMVRKHLRPKSNFARLRSALEACEQDSAALTPRDVGWVRRALANTVTRHGAPRSERRAALRAMQGAIAAQPSYVDLAQIVAGRLDRYPGDGGIPSLDPIASDIGEDEASHPLAGHPVPPHFVAKAARALEAPIDELVEREIITSGEVLARVLPQITAQLFAAAIDDRALSSVYGQTYAAFRRRRSLLLLNLEHQVRFEELPWIAALEPFRTAKGDVTRSARQTLEEATIIALTAFPHAIFPNPLVRELSALAERANLRLPLVEEVAADIFMGTFTEKWRKAAAIASRTLQGTLYARYYDLPSPDTWDQPGRLAQAVTRRWGKSTAEDFATMCKTRSQEAHAGESGSYVAANGAILEQSQILTTHNLAVLVDALGLAERLTRVAPHLAERTFTWLLQRQSQKIDQWHARLQMVKNTAYAWRQAIFFLSFCETPDQRRVLAHLEESLAGADVAARDRLRPAVNGLARVVSGDSFDDRGLIRGDASARRFLGWAVGAHWMLPAEQTARA